MSMASNSLSSAKIAFHPNEHIWLCLTTLLHRRFVEDAIHVIGLPHGSPIRLRYRRQYIDPSLWNEISAGRVDSDAVVLIALGVTGPDDRNIVSPLREGRVVSARCEGSVLIIDIHLRSFVYCSAISTSFWDEIQLIAKDLPAAFGTKEGVEGTYLQALSSPPQAVLAGVRILLKTAASSGRKPSTHNALKAATCNASNASLTKFEQSCMGYRLLG